MEGHSFCSLNDDHILGLKIARIADDAPGITTKPDKHSLSGFVFLSLLIHQGRIVEVVACQLEHYRAE